MAKGSGISAFVLSLVENERSDVTPDVSRTDARQRLHSAVDGAAPRHLKAGDAACYQGERPHLLRNGSDKKRMSLICVDSTRVL